MKFFIENWAIIIGIIAVGILLGIAIYRFVKLSKEDKIFKVKEWLLFAVIEAEKQLGAKTGVLKLRKVYDLFVSKFPTIAKFISFEKFSGLVDEALETVQNWLDTNEAIKNYVEGDKE